MKKKKTHSWIVFIVIAAVLIGFALFKLISPMIDRWQSAKDYKELADTYVSVNETSKDDGKQKQKDWWLTDVKIEFDRLKEQNPDIIGWIRFDNQDELGINYPILYSGDNEKYLRSDIYGNEHIAGSIFLEALNNADFSDYYNILYGHKVIDGSMFGSLYKYKDDGFWEDNQYFTVYTETTAYRYRIFSYEDAVNGGDVYKIGYKPGDEYQKFIDAMIDASDISTGIKPKSSNKIITLSTCTGDGYDKRFAVYAVCVDAQTTDSSKLKQNTD